MEDIRSRRYIHLMKESAQCYWAMMPFEKILKKLIAPLMMTAVLFDVNAFFEEWNFRLQSNDHTL